MNYIMVLKDHSGFKYVDESMFLGQSKDKMSVFKMSVDLLRSDVKFVKRIQFGGDMENS